MTTANYLFIYLFAFSFIYLSIYLFYFLNVEYLFIYCSFKMYPALPTCVALLPQ